MRILLDTHVGENSMEIPTVDLSKFIVELAKRHGVVYVRTGMGAWQRSSLTCLTMR